MEEASKEISKTNVSNAQLMLDGFVVGAGVKRIWWPENHDQSNLSDLSCNRMMVTRSIIDSDWLKPQHELNKLKY